MHWYLLVVDFVEWKIIWFNIKKFAWSWTIHVSYSFKTMLHMRSQSVLNMTWICGFTTILCSLCDKITSSTYCFNKRKLFSISLIESFSATYYEDLTVFCASSMFIAWSVIWVSLKLGLMFNFTTMEQLLWILNATLVYYTHMV